MDYCACVYAEFFNIVESNNVTMLQDFLEYHPKIDVSMDGNKALSIATENGNLEMIHFMLTFQNVTPYEKPNAALFTAIEAGHLDIVKFYLDDCTAPDPDNVKACSLVFAADVARGSLVRYLLERHDIDPKYADGAVLRTVLWRLGATELSDEERQQYMQISQILIDDGRIMVE